MVVVVVIISLVVAKIVVFVGVVWFVVVGMFFVVMLLSKQEGANKQMKERGYKVEQLPGKIEGAVLSPNVKNCGVFVILF